MPILYKAEKFPQPGVSGGGIPQYRASIVYRGTIYMDQIVKDIELMTSVSAVDVESVVLALRNRLEYYLTDGYRVVINHLGTYTPFMQSHACLRMNQVNVNTIKRVTIGYRPCARLENALFNATFEKARKGY